jgi:tetratricopeptide (TPR) repeat protein
MNSPQGQASNLREAYLKCKCNYCVALINSNNITIALEILPTVIDDMITSHIDDETISIAYTLWRNCYIVLIDYSTVIEIFQKELEYFENLYGLISEPALTVINNIAMFYISIKDYEKGLNGSKYFLQLLCELQGIEHEDRIKSIELFQNVFKEQFDKEFTYP